MRTKAKTRIRSGRRVTSFYRITRELGASTSASAPSHASPVPTPRKIKTSRRASRLWKLIFEILPSREVKIRACFSGRVSRIIIRGNDEADKRISWSKENCLVDQGRPRFLHFSNKYEYNNYSNVSDYRVSSPILSSASVRFFPNAFRLRHSSSLVSRSSLFTYTRVSFLLFVQLFWHIFL